MPDLRVDAVTRTPAVQPIVIGTRRLTVRGERGAGRLPNPPPATTLTLSGTSTRTVASNLVSEEVGQNFGLRESYRFFVWLFSGCGIFLIVDGDPFNSGGLGIDVCSSKCRRGRSARRAHL